MNNLINEPETKTIRLEKEVKKAYKSVAEKISTANAIIASAIDLIIVENILHPDNGEDLKFVVEDFLFSVSNEEFDDFAYNYCEEPEDEL